MTAIDPTPCRDHADRYLGNGINFLEDFLTLPHTSPTLKFLPRSNGLSANNLQRFSPTICITGWITRLESYDFCARKLKLIFEIS